MKIHVLFFAKAREIVGQERVEIDLPDHGTLYAIRHELGQKYPQLTPLVPWLMFACQNEFLLEDQPILPDSEVACFPPVSGG
jgi:molybdopterin converting factor subunit 1